MRLIINIILISRLPKIIILILDLKKFVNYIIILFLHAYLIYIHICNNYINFCALIFSLQNKLTKLYEIHIPMKNVYIYKSLEKLRTGRNMMMTHAIRKCDTSLDCYFKTFTTNMMTKLHRAVKEWQNCNNIKFGRKFLSNINESASIQQYVYAILQCCHLT